MKRGWWCYIPHALAVLATLALLYRLRATLAPFFIAYVLAAVLDPVAQKLERRGWKRVFAVLCIFALFLAAFAGFLVLLVPIAVGQIKQLSDSVPNYVRNLPGLVDSVKAELAALPLPGFVQERLGGLTLPEYLSALLEQHAEPAYQALLRQVGVWVQGIVGSLGFLLWLVIIPIATFYLLMDMPRIRVRCLKLVPMRYRGAAQSVAHDVAEVFFNYLRGLSLVSVLYGVMIWVILTALGVPYALALALLAGVLYPVPYLGPLLTTVTVVLVTGFALDWVKGAVGGAGVLGANVVFDQVLTPRVVGRSVGLHPVLSMMALLVGADLFGVVGMVLAVPAAGALQVVALRLLPRWTREETPSEVASGDRLAPTAETPAHQPPPPQRADLEGASGRRQTSRRARRPNLRKPR
ncbi:MAG: AI-2E family transporter [Armatimonadota bacterium]|nr:AI-2E family transporter [Armatimonadota bacterium]